MKIFKKISSRTVFLMALKNPDIFEVSKIGLQPIKSTPCPLTGRQI